MRKSSTSKRQTESGWLVAGGAGRLDRDPLLVGAAVAEPGERVVAALVGLDFEAGGVRDVGGDEVGEQLQRLDPLVVEVGDDPGVDLEHADHLAAVHQRHADHRGGADPGAGGGVDAGVDRGVVAAQQPAFGDAAAGEAAGLLQPQPDVGGGLAGGDLVDHLVAVGDLDHRAAGRGQFLAPLGDQLHRLDQVEAGGRDLGLGADDRPQAILARIECHVVPIGSLLGNLRANDLELSGAWPGDGAAHLLVEGEGDGDGEGGGAAGDGGGGGRAASSGQALARRARWRRCR